MRAYVSDYAGVMDAVAREAVAQDDGNARAGDASIADALNQPKAVVKQVLHVLEGRGLVKVLPLGNREMRVERVSVELKRRYR